MVDKTYTNYLGTFQGERPSNGISNQPVYLDTDMMEKGELPLPRDMYNEKYGTKKKGKTTSLKSKLKKTVTPKKVEGQRVTTKKYVIEKTPTGSFLVFDKSGNQIKPTNKPLVEVFNIVIPKKEITKSPSDLTTRQLGTKIFKKLLDK
jgi:hypothetical protein